MLRCSLGPKEVHVQIRCLSYAPPQLIARDAGLHSKQASEQGATARRRSGLPTRVLDV